MIDKSDVLIGDLSVAKHINPDILSLYCLTSNTLQDIAEIIFQLDILIEKKGGVENGGGFTGDIEMSGIEQLCETGDINNSGRIELLCGNW
jgi:hypothetical protein